MGQGSDKASFSPIPVYNIQSVLTNINSEDILVANRHHATVNYAFEERVSLDFLCGFGGEDFPAKPPTAKPQRKAKGKLFKTFRTFLKKPG